ncbi:methylamine utilization protein [Massilia sp. TS11]|uniref:methylamine utilization protein n=1 Tax=Massilia sp. TS11 TaxID=2908003 RepID=UPI001EDA0506|nr:methylamine utilization protein [Massilia sp. TS11]MCG2584647.1 methylamine utilization protein [Massilia sp. TS11]
MKLLTCLLAALAAVPSLAAPLSVQVLDSAGKPVADAVVFAELEGAPAKGGGKQATIEQKGLKFIPLVTVVQTGTTINFPNNDKVRHHIYSFSPAHKFDQKLYSGTAATPQVFDKAGVVVLGCNIHDRMVAYVKVVDTALFAKTDAEGKATLDIPGGGKYAVKAWHYNQAGAGAPDQSLTVKGAEALPPLVFRTALKPPASEPEQGS